MRIGNKYLVLMAAFLWAVASLAQTNVVDEIVWVVGDEAILRSDVEKRRNEYGNSMTGNPYCVIPEQLAIQKLFLHQAAIDSVEVTDAEVNPYVEQDINEKVLMAGSKEKLEEYMQMNMRQIREELFDQYKNELTARKMRERLTSDIKVTPAEVRRYFKDMPEDSLPLIPTQVEVQVLALQPRIRQEEIDRVKDVLRGYAERVSNGSTSFSTLARLYSEDPGSARQGGELPFMGRGELDPAFANVAFSLTDPSKVSKIVKSDFGYHIIQLIEKRGDKLKCRHILMRPEVAQADIDTAMAHLDSIAEDIRTGKVSFENAVLYASDDKDTRNNHGIMTNTKENGERTTRFEMAELSAVSPELARVVEGMQTGEISKPFTMVNSKGITMCALVRLKSRIKAHRANIAEDFQVLKGVVENQRSQERILGWIKEKQRSTYIRINPDWRDCDFQYPGWVK
ncbi:MAG TPA: peptidylprolyl isomerase [Prevotellaceae bacterium]|nr:peptidylprolyl isomerase [Prevotellaceae bacterium]HBE54981.1 peptidylprolyl isomerase [Prevotellaceae bacterium]